jgi:hypothetical protein
MVQSLQGSIYRLPSLCPTLRSPAGRYLRLWPEAPAPAPALGPGPGVWGPGPGTRPRTRARLVVVTRN